MFAIRQRHAGLAWLLTLLAVLTLTRGDELVRWTVRHALAFWFVGTLLRIRGSGRARLPWTLACVSYLIHVAAAFEVAHHWSHREAFEHVRAASGYGEGIFVSYFFTLLWVAEVIWWNASMTSYANRPRWLNGCVQGFMWFMVFNATVVFESGAIRWVGLAGFAALGVGLWGRARNHK